jgi:hypothetical protein
MLASKESEKMPLFQLPFYLRNVEQGVVAGFSCAAVFTLVTVLADREIWPFRLIVELFLAVRMGLLEPEKRFAIFKKMMYVFQGYTVDSTDPYGLWWSPLALAWSFSNCCGTGSI